MSHSATSPRRTSRRLSGLQNNHNETLIAARPCPPVGPGDQSRRDPIADGRAWPDPELRRPVTLAPVG